MMGADDGFSEIPPVANQDHKKKMIGWEKKDIWVWETTP
jgi:hypothetical protein